MKKAKQSKWMCGGTAWRNAWRAETVCGLVAGGLLWSCSAQNQPLLTGSVSDAPKAASDNSASDPARRFIGKGPADVMRELGPPTKVMPSDVTGGKIYVYARPGQPRYVFETDRTNKIDLAVTVD
jgi:hypothetical protein